MSNDDQRLPIAGPQHAGELRRDETGILCECLFVEGAGWVWKSLGAADADGEEA